MSEPADAQADRAAQERYTRRLAEAGAVARRFREAANGGDADGAQAQATDAGWSLGRDSLRGLVAQVIHKGLSLDPVGDDPALFGERGAAWVVISHPSRDAPLGGDARERTSNGESGGWPWFGTDARLWRLQPSRRAT